METMGITPIVFSPPPANGNNIGQCLARANWLGLGLDKCSFFVSEMSQATADAYRFLENIGRKYRVIRLDDLICTDSLCNVHINSAFIYLDRKHLSIEGSTMLGERNDFYGMIVDGYSDQNKGGVVHIDQ